MRSTVFALLLLILLPTAVAAEDAFDPDRTHALIVGVLKWKDPSITSFAAEDRKDRALLETLVRRGVKRERTRILLDGQATMANIRKALAELLKAVGEKDTLIVYYAGHGDVVDDKTIVFLEYDYDEKKPKTSGLTVPRLTKMLGDGFRGRRLLLFADCCHSGGMARVAKGLADKKKLSAASLTSADDSNLSTGNWTFTMTILDGLRGRPIVDANRDGSITLEELSTEVGGAMKYRELQLHGFARHGIPAGFRIAKARGTFPKAELPGPFSRKQYVRVLSTKGTRIGRVLDAKGGKYSVELQGYADRETVWKARSELEPIRFDRYEEGTKLRVLWEDRLWDAKVVRRKGDFHWITYPGWPPVWDEWVLSDRIQPPGLTPEKALERARCGGRYSTLLKVIEVEADLENYGLFCEEGYFEVDEWAGYDGLPHGHWVYVYPRWYIFKDRLGSK